MDIEHRCGVRKLRVFCLISIWKSQALRASDIDLIMSTSSNNKSNNIKTNFNSVFSAGLGKVCNVQYSACRSSYVFVDRCRRPCRSCMVDRYLSVALLCLCPPHVFTSSSSFIAHLLLFYRVVEQHHGWLQSVLL